MIQITCPWCEDIAPLEPELLDSAEQALGLAKKAGRRRTAQSNHGHTH